MVNYDSRVVYSFLHTTKDLGDPGSSRGTLERVRVDLTLYEDPDPYLGFWICGSDRNIYGSSIYGSMIHDP